MYRKNHFRFYEFLVLLCCFVFNCPSVSARSYPFVLEQYYEIEQVRVAQQGLKYVKVFGIGKNADRAIEKAKQNAVAACIFYGVPATDTAGLIPPLCPGGVSDYEKNKSYFDSFFTSGEFLNYVDNVNSRYPSGENNVSVDKGRKVGIYATVKYDLLRKLLEQDGIIRSLDSYF